VNRSLVTLSGRTDWGRAQRGSEEGDYNEAELGTYWGERASSKYFLHTFTLNPIMQPQLPEHVHPRQEAGKDLHPAEASRRELVFPSATSRLILHGRAVHPRIPGSSGYMKEESDCGQDCD